MWLAKNRGYRQPRTDKAILLMNILINIVQFDLKIILMAQTLVKRPYTFILKTYIVMMFIS